MLYKVKDVFKYIIQTFFLGETRNIVTSVDIVVLCLFVLISMEPLSKIL